MKEKLKSLLQNDQLYLVVVVCLVGLLSFGLGRWSIVPVTSQTAAVITINDLTPEVRPTVTPVVSPVVGQGVNSSEVEAPTPAPGRVVVASRNGTRYHLPACSGAKQIKPENLITFPSAEAARAAGYTPAANCPGL